MYLNNSLINKIASFKSSILNLYSSSVPAEKLLLQHSLAAAFSCLRISEYHQATLKLVQERGIGLSMQISFQTAFGKQMTLILGVWFGEQVKLYVVQAKVLVLQMPGAD